MHHSSTRSFDKHIYIYIFVCVCVSVSLTATHSVNWNIILFNALRPRWNGRHFADDILYRIFVNWCVLILIEISLTFVPYGPIIISALIQIMAWCYPGDKLLSEPMMISLPTHICVTRPQWVQPGNNFSLYITLPKCEFPADKWMMWLILMSLRPQA